VTYYTPVEVAKILKLDPATVRRACQSGRIDAAKPFGQWRISERALQDFIENSKPKRDPGVLKPSEPRATVNATERYRARLRAITKEAT